MELSIIIAIFTTAAVGFCGGIIFAHIFELPDQRALRKELRRTKRALRAERARKTVNFTKTFY